MTPSAVLRSLVGRFGLWWDNHFEALGRAVGRTVPLAVRARWLIVLICVGLVAGAIAMVPLGFIGSEYAPQEDDNMFSVNLNTPPGTALPATDAAAKQMETYLAQMPEVQYIFTSVACSG